MCKYYEVNGKIQYCTHECAGCMFYEDDAMTETCRECKFRYICEELEYELTCTDQSCCEHFDVYLEGLETTWI